MVGRDLAIAVAQILDGSESLGRDFPEVLKNLLDDDGWPLELGQEKTESA